MTMTINQSTMSQASDDDGDDDKDEDQGGRDDDDDIDKDNKDDVDKGEETEEDDEDDDDDASADASIPEAIVVPQRAPAPCYVPDPKHDVNSPAMVRRLLMGDMEQLKPFHQPKGKLSVFVSSTFTDTHAERNVLLEEILPRLQARARPHGVAVMFSDMRFGVKDDSTKEHDTWEVCAREIQRCHEESDGAFFLSLQSDRYGYQALPKYLPMDIVQAKLADEALSSDTRRLLQIWYVLDENSLPAAVFVLKPLPDGKTEQAPYWNKALPALLHVLADVVFGQTAGQVSDLVVKRSVTEWETKFALDLLPAGKVLHFDRRLTGSSLGFPDVCDVVDKPEDERKLASLFAHLRSPRYTAQYAQQHMGSVTVKSYVAKDHLFEAYIAGWKAKAEAVLDQELSGVLTKSKRWDGHGLGCKVAGKLLEELLHHVRFQAERCAHFFGRSDLLEKARALIQSTQRAPGLLSAISFCVVGVSGSGKTSLMSTIAAALRASTDRSIPVIVRYCGTSSMSCDGFSLVRSLIWQIQYVYDLDPDCTAWPSFDTYHAAVRVLHGLLEQYPVALLVDSLDQMSNQYEESTHISFLKGCNAHKDSCIVISTLQKGSDGVGNPILFKAEALLSRYDIRRIEVPSLDISCEPKVKELVYSLLHRKGRTLHSDVQWQVMWRSIQVEPTILYITVACTLIERWRSSDHAVVLIPTVKGLINALFDRLEKVYGVQLIRHTIGFLTFNQSGLNDTELVDLLSMSDAVLEEVFQYTKLEAVTVHRVPVHVWLRVKQELSPFVVEKTNGTMRWYHRQLWETAEGRYSNQAKRPFHVLMGQYFAGIFPEDIRVKRHISANDVTVSSQPSDAVQSASGAVVWWKDSAHNLRRCTEAAFQSTQAEMRCSALVVKRVLMGDVSLVNVVGMPNRKLSLYLASTFTDTAAERDTLLHEILPRLQARAKPFGVSVMFTDMRFGMKDENAEEHDTWEVCAREIKRCHEESDGAFFLSLQGDKYGYSPLPKCLLMSTVQEKLASPDISEKDKDLLREWYILDENCLPAPLYALKSLPSENAGKGQFYNEVLPVLLLVLQDVVFAQTAGQVTDLLVKRSFSEWEPKFALDLIPAGRMLHFQRRFQGNLAEFYPLLQDVHDKPEEAKKLADLLAFMRSRPDQYVHVHMGSVAASSYVAKDHLFDAYIASWKTKAEAVLDRELSDVLAKAERWDSNGLGCNIAGRILEELLHHIQLQNDRCSRFYGRQELVVEALEHITSAECRGRSGLYGAISTCVVGRYGSGMTFLMCMIASWLGDVNHQRAASTSIPTIIRLCGTSSMSSDGFSLVRSLIWQIQYVYDMDPDCTAWPSFDTYHAAVRVLHGLLEQYPVILVIDGLDKLSDGYEESSRMSFLQGCKAHEKSVIVVSTVTDSYDKVTKAFLERNAFRRFQVSMFDTGKENVGQVKNLVFRLLLEGNSKTLATNQQWLVMLNYLRTEPTIFYITIACSLAERWRSSDTTVALTPKVDGIINQLFDRLEKVYGICLIRHITGFITFSKAGITSAEMNDLLSCSDEVMSEVCQYHEGRDRRIPAHIWPRVLTELTPFLRGTYNEGLRWCNVQCRASLVGRCYQSESYFHSFLGQYFGGLIPKETCQRRHIMPQDIVLSSPSQPFHSSAVWHKDSVVNVRRCTEALSHMVKAGRNDASYEMYDEAMREICNVQHVCAYVRAGKGHELLKKLLVLNNVNCQLKKRDVKKMRNVSHYLNWLQTSIHQLVADPFNQFLFTAMRQPAHSIVRRAMAAQVMRRGALAFTCKRLGGWDSFQNNLLGVLEGHNGEVTFVSVSHDRKKVFSGSADCTAKVWDKSTGACLRTLTGHSASVLAVCCSLDEVAVVTGSADNTVKVWEIQYGDCLHTLHGHEREVVAVCISVDGSLIASGSEDRTIRVWALPSGECLHTLCGHQTAVHSVWLTCTNAQLISRARDNTIMLWDVQSESCLKVYAGYAAHGLISVFCTNNIVCGAEDAVEDIIRILWNGVARVMETQAIRAVHPVEEAVGFFPDGSGCICTSGKNTLKAWDFRNGDCLQTLHVLGDHCDRITALCGSEDGIFISGGSDGSIKMWIPDYYYSFGERPSTPAPRYVGHSQCISAVCFTPDSSSIISAAADGIRVWDALSGDCQYCFDGQLGSVTALCILPDGSTIVSATDGHEIKIWSALSGQCVATLQSRSKGVKTICCSLNGAKIIFGTCERTVEILDARSQQWLPAALQTSGDVLSVHPALDDNLCIVLVDSGHCYSYLKWDLHSGQCLSTIATTLHPISCLTMDCRKLLSLDPAGVLAVTDVSDNVNLLKNQAIQDGHKSDARSICASSDETIAVTGSLDRSIKIWDMVSGECLSTLQLPSPVSKVCFSADDKKIVAGCRDGSLWVFDIVDQSQLQQQEE